MPRNTPPRRFQPDYRVGRQRRRLSHQLSEHRLKVPGSKPFEIQLPE